MSRKKRKINGSSGARKAYRKPTLTKHGQLDRIAHSTIRC